MNLGSILWLIPVLPLAGALANGFRAWGNQAPKNRKVTNAIAIGSTALSALLATFAVITWATGAGHEPFVAIYYAWVPAGLGHVGGALADFTVNFGLRVDALSSTMMMVVCWVGFVIHVYSIGYMAHEKSGYTRFFTYMNLFMFMMLLLVMGSNYLVLFVGWEGVGLCSYLLIGYFYDKNFAADAGKKAFITNRIGDFGFILGLFLMFNKFGTVDFTKVFGAVSAQPEAYAGVATAICLLLFVGATGKSAQVPLYVWLPDAMAGPTPVSALIHAATMVTAGVYMVVRSNVLFRLSPVAMLVVAIVGAFTAIFAASIGMMQNDIKKVLAYSTVSQLGYMFLAAGVGAFTAAIFHLMTHAFFKGCLFLCAGSVIHGCGGEQDMRWMGGLKKYMPSTWKTMLIATLAISGIPPLAAFFSKDEILASAFVTRFEALGAPWSSVPLICWFLGMIAALMTAFYMFRLYYMTFEGEYRGAEKAADAHGDDHGDAHGHGEPHESPATMTSALWVLAILSIIGGFVGIPFGAFGSHRPTWFQEWLQSVLLPLGHHTFHFEHSPVALEWTLMALSVGIAVAGLMLARKMYFVDKTWTAAKGLAARFPGIYRAVANKYFVDEFYYATFISGTIGFGRVLSWFDAHIVDGLVNLVRHITVIIFGEGSSLFDKYVVDGAVNGLANGAKGSSSLLRRLQTGMVQNYLLVMGGGVVVLVMVYLFVKP